MDTKKIKKSTKKLNKLVLQFFPEAQLENSILFESFPFAMIDIETGSQPINFNYNWLIGNNENIFLISDINHVLYVQKLENPLTFVTPPGFLHPEFNDLVKLNFKNFSSYLLYSSLENKLSKKNKSSFSKI